MSTKRQRTNADIQRMNNTSTTTCLFNNPINLSTTSTVEDWEYSTQECETSYSYIYNGFTWGEIVMSAFLYTLCAIFLFIGMWKFFIRR